MSTIIPNITNGLVLWHNTTKRKNCQNWNYKELSLIYTKNNWIDWFEDWNIYHVIYYITLAISTKSGSLMLYWLYSWFSSYLQITQIMVPYAPLPPFDVFRRPFSPSTSGSPEVLGRRGIATAWLTGWRLAFLCTRPVWFIWLVIYWICGLIDKENSGKLMCEIEYVNRFIKYTLMFSNLSPQSWTTYVKRHLAVEAVMTGPT